MITEQQLKADCTPELIKKMVELAEGFEVDTDGVFYNGIILPNGTEVDFDIQHELLFSLLIHRAVEGWNIIISNSPYCNAIDINCEAVIYRTKNNLHDMMGAEEREYLFKNYSPSSLTHAECAMLHCLQEVIK